MEYLRIIRNLLFIAVGLLFGRRAMGENMMGDMASCPMCNPSTAWFGIILAVLLMMAIIGVLVALSFNLFRKTDIGIRPVKMSRGVVASRRH
jgi:hypothetical protein